MGCTYTGNGTNNTCKGIVSPAYHKHIEHYDPISNDGINIDIDNIFTELMTTVRKQLDIEFKAGRIKGAEYAAAIQNYIPEMMKDAVSFSTAQYEAEKIAFEIKVEGIRVAKELEKLSSEIALSEAQAELAKESVLKTQAEKGLACTQSEELVKNGKSKRALECEEIVVKGKMAELYEAQKNGFQDKSANDTFRTISNMWSVFISEVYDGVKITPAQMEGGNIDSIIGSMRRKTGI